MEAALSISPYVENIMVHADPFYSFCVALVVASQQTLENWASKQGIDSTNFEELCAKEQTVKEVYASLVKVIMFISEKALYRDLCYQNQFLMIYYICGMFM